jgi:hypothetical protein
MHIATSATVTTHGRVIHVDVVGGGAVDYSTRACEMTIASTVAGVGAGARNITTELRIVGGYVYVRLPNGIGGAALPPGKTWMRQPVPPALAGAGSNDPSQAIDELRSIARELRLVGTESVGGVETTHYGATVVLAGTQAWASIQAANPAMARNPLMQSLAHQPLNMDAWIDEGGRLRRLTETIHFALAGLVPVAAPGDGEDVHLALDIPEYGAPVRVQPPRAGEVVDQAVTGLFGNPLAPPG